MKFTGTKFRWYRHQIPKHLVRIPVDSDCFVAGIGLRHPHPVTAGLFSRVSRVCPGQAAGDFLTGTMPRSSCS